LVIGGKILSGRTKDQNGAQVAREPCEGCLDARRHLRGKRRAPAAPIAAGSSLRELV
jgi:hypothetical protein